MSDPLHLPCLHLATSQELERDPGYQACAAQPGQPCTWAQRFDGFTNPTFHTERLESAANNLTPGSPLDINAIREAVLASGLV